MDQPHKEAMMESGKKLYTYLSIAVMQLAVSGSQAQQISAQERIICANERVPHGYVVVRYLRHDDCPALLVDAVIGSSSKDENAKTVKLPGQRETVCADSPVPPGYRRVRQVTNFQCKEVLRDAIGGLGTKIDNSWVIERRSE